MAKINNFDKDDERPKWSTLAKNSWTLRYSRIETLLHMLMRSWSRFWRPQKVAVNLGLKLQCSTLPDYHIFHSSGTTATPLRYPIYNCSKGRWTLNYYHSSEHNCKRKHYCNNNRYHTYLFWRRFFLKSFFRVTIYN